MRQIYYTIRTLLRERGSNIIRIISLSLGLTIGILLFSQIAFELSYEQCYPEAERLALVRCQRINLSTGETAGDDKETSYDYTVFDVLASTLAEEMPKEVHQARKFGKTKFGGWNRFFNGYLDLISLWFLSTFGIKPMHFFGILGSLMFFVGFVAVIIVGASKLYYMNQGMPYRLVTDSPYFYLSLTSMIIGTQLFVAGFLGELISRNAPERNKYQIEKMI